MKKKYWIGIFVLALFFYLLMNPEDSLKAVQEGLSLWYRSVLPVLFPFLILSGLVTRLELTRQVPDELLIPICRLFHCSHQGSFAILSGFLCGFPMGAKMTRNLQSSRLITEEESCYLYGFVNNVSPAFLISFLAQEQLRRPEYKLFFLFCILGSAILWGLITRPGNRHFANTENRDRTQGKKNRDTSDLFSDIDDCIQEGVIAAVKLGAYITIFSLLSSVSECLLPPSELLQAFAAGLLEITNGCTSVADLNLPLNIKLIWLCAICSFGGLSAFAQTVSIASMNRSAAFRYIKSRVAITLLASLLAFGILFFRRLLLL